MNVWIVVLLLYFKSSDLVLGEKRITSIVKFLLARRNVVNTILHGVVLCNRIITIPLVKCNMNNW